MRALVASDIWWVEEPTRGIMCTVRRLITCLSACLALTVAACSDGADPASAPRDPASSPTGAQVEVGAAATVLVPVIERLDTGDALRAGPGEEQLTITSVASDGDVVIAAAALADEQRLKADPVLFRSTDGRDWERVDIADVVSGQGGVRAVVTTSDGFLAAGSDGDGEPVILRSADGAEWEAGSLEFERGETQDVFQVAAMAASGDRVMVLGFALEGMSGDGSNASGTVRIGLVASADGGTTWELVQPPEVEDAGEPFRAASAEAVPMLVAHGEGFLLGTGPRGPLGRTTALWSQAPGDGWARIGGTAELFDDAPLQFLHSAGDAILAFTRAGDDLTAWTSTNGGVSFERIDAGPGQFGGVGTQAVDAAVTLSDGVTVVAGRTMATQQPLQTETELELWVTPDLARWHRAIADASLAGSGVQQAAGVVPLADGALVVGTDERRATAEELEDSSSVLEAGAPHLLPPLARHGAVWAVGLREEDRVAAPAEVTPLDVRGFEGLVTVRDVVSYGDGLAAAGWVGIDGESRAAVWTSEDGQDWVEVASPALSEPFGQRIYALTATADGGLVAVGSATRNDDPYLGVWTSPDGREWTRSEPAFESSTGFGVAETADGLVAVGAGATAEPDVHRKAGVWLSTDGGLTWSTADTASDPFGRRDVEVLSDVVMSDSGRLVAVGYAGDVESPEPMTYIPEPLVLESSDGTRWSALDPPVEAPDSALPQTAAFHDDDLLVLGWVHEGGSGEVTTSRSGVFIEGPGGWSEPDQRFRHRSSIAAAAPIPGGLVVAGEWGRPAGLDALIAVVHGGQVTYLTDGMVAEGNQRAVGAAPLGDDVIVLGRDDEPAVLGWRVSTTQPS